MESRAYQQTSHIEERFPPCGFSSCFFSIHPTCLYAYSRHSSAPQMFGTAIAFISENV